MLASWVRDTTATTGTGTVTLDGSPSAGFIGFDDAFSTGQVVSYTIEDGNNRESGLGTLTSGASWTLSRDTIHETLVSGTYSKMPATGITLSGNATVGIAPNAASSKQVAIPKHIQDNLRWIPFQAVTAPVNVPVIANGAPFMPFDVDSIDHIDDVQVFVAIEDASATKAYAGIYDADENGRPNKLIGEVSIDISTTGYKVGTFSSPLYVTPGRHFFAFATDSSTASLSGFSDIKNYIHNGTMVYLSNSPRVFFQSSALGASLPSIATVNNNWNQVYWFTLYSAP